MSVSERVTECREALGLSKAQLAKKAGFPRATITHVEQRNSDGLSQGLLKNCWLSMKARLKGKYRSSYDLDLNE